MANVVVSLDVLEVALDWMVATGGEYYLKLFCNDYTPTHDMVPGSFTEASGGGYSHKSVTSGEWTKEYSNNPPNIILAEQTFLFSGELTTNPTVYGWYLIKQDLSAVRTAKRLDSTYTPASGGGTLKFTPRIQAGNGTPA
jgi:hypothetical protein